MMATTHALYGMAVGALLVPIAPEYAPAAMVVGFVAGFLPDLDVYADHRRTLHFPVYASFAAIPAVAFAVLVPSLPTVLLATAVVAVALHTVMDAAGGGLSLRPWEDQPDRAVYSHFHGRWVAPRRLVAYDGAPSDLVLALGAGIPLLAVATDPIRTLVAGTLLVSTGYVLVRKHLVEIISVAVRYTPQSLHVFVPRRFDHLVER
ncbi:metal-dependent hydrolase [Salinibaculum salinum]|uniref:metal-dependent hydrolase n=1 Tax=Salinibaculum salinum TaxID=3131996 RepID=UPI0030EBE295